MMDKADEHALRWYRKSLMLKMPAHIKEGQALVGRLFMEKPFNDPVIAVRTDVLKLRASALLACYSVTQRHDAACEVAWKVVVRSMAGLSQVLSETDHYEQWRRQ